jgi:hypothetical protein
MHMSSVHAASSTFDLKSLFSTPQSTKIQFNLSMNQTTMMPANSPHHMPARNPTSMSTKQRKWATFSCNLPLSDLHSIIHISSKHICIPNWPSTLTCEQTLGRSSLLHNIASHNQKPMWVAHTTFNQISGCHSEPKTVKCKSLSLPI